MATVSSLVKYRAGMPFSSQDIVFVVKHALLLSEMYHSNSL